MAKFKESSDLTKSSWWYTLFFVLHTDLLQSDDALIAQIAGFENHTVSTLAELLELLARALHGLFGLVGSILDSLGTFLDGIGDSLFGVLGRILDSLDGVLGGFGNFFFSLAIVLAREDHHRASGDHGDGNNLFHK